MILFLFIIVSIILSIFYCKFLYYLGDLIDKNKYTSNINYNICILYVIIFSILYVIIFSIIVGVIVGININI